VTGRSERERMLAGEFYDPRDPELLALAHRTRALVARYNATVSTDAAGRRALLEQVLGSMAEEVWIEPPFFCEYGAHVSIGARTFINVNAVFLDAAPIRIGADVLIGPGVQLLTARHPLRAAERIVADRSSLAPGAVPYRTDAAPVTIGRGAWLGAGTIVLPGVTIGDETTIGAGSVVTRDVPAGVLALGQPCRVVRTL
jgi:maltose O-acetyltransferase